MSTLPLADIRIDLELQARACGIRKQTVYEYCEAVRPSNPDIAPAVLPPVIVFKDSKGVHWLADGFHRHAAALLAEFTEIAVDVREGTRRDAQLFAIGANTTHGLKRSNADRKKAALMLLNDTTWGKRTDAWIAKSAAVSAPFVAKLRSTLNISSGPRETADGRVMDTTKIGKRAASDDVAVVKLTETIEASIAKWPDSKHDALRTLLTTWIDVLAPAGAAE